METSPLNDLTFRGQVKGSSDHAGVPGARVEVWIDATTTQPFVAGQTDQAGGFLLRGELRESLQAVTVRVTPPAGSGLQAATFGGRISDIFPVFTGSDARYTYLGYFVLQPAAGS